MDWGGLSYGDCHTYLYPAAAEIFTLRLHRSVQSHNSVGGDSLPEGWLSPINPTPLVDKQKETKWGEMWQNRCYFVILCSCYHGFNFPSFSQLAALLYLISIFIDRWPVTGWREARKTNGKGAEREGVRDPRDSSLTVEVPCSAGFWFEKNKGDFS